MRKYLESIITYKKITLASFFLAMCQVMFAQAEYPFPSLSPKGKLTQIIGTTVLKIDYERPSVRKRKVFGELVPWNKVWRTGAGYCTKLSVSKSVIIRGQKVPAGTYSLFSIPNPEEWIIILNKDTTLYGSSFYNSQNDIARFIVIPQQSSRFYETLNFDIEIIPNNARVYISWDHTQISFRIETSTDKSIEKLIQEEFLSGKNKKSNLYAGAAEYYLFQGTNLLDVITLSNKALELDDKNGWARLLKIKAYEKLKLYNEALEEIQTGMRIIQNNQYEKEEYRTNELNNLKKVQERIHKKTNK